METLLVRPENAEHLKTVKAVLKALNVDHVAKKEKKYNREFVKKIQESRLQAKEGKVTSINLIIFIVIFFISIHNNLSAKTTTDTSAKTWSSIFGTLIDSKTKEPIMNVYVRLFQKNIEINKTLTDTNGTYHFDNLKPGIYDIMITRVDYDSITMTDLNAIYKGEVCELQQDYSLVKSVRRTIFHMDSLIVCPIPCVEDLPDPGTTVYAREEIQNMPY